MRIKFTLALVFVLCAVSFGVREGFAQSQGREYFPETGHWVAGEFLAAYRSIPEPERIYGYPITDAFQNLTTDHLVQYFQKAHFELRPDAPPELRVHRTLLGEYFYQPGQSIPLQANAPGCRTFPETKRQVCYAFLRFFDDNGGVSQFGYPISEVEIRNQTIVQYFQRAVFEWHPELPSGERVVLSDLGWQYFWWRKEDPVRLRAVADSQVRVILDLKARAFPTRAVISTGEIQTLHIIVQDQNLLPIADASVQYTVRYPNGEETTTLIPQKTDKNGIVSTRFEVSEKTIGIAEVIVKVTYDTFQKQTVTSFRLWW